MIEHTYDHGCLCAVCREHDAHLRFAINHEKSQMKTFTVLSEKAPLRNVGWFHQVRNDRNPKQKE